MKLLSVILPVFNAEKYVSEAIYSILNQSFSDFEFIVINDGSTDNSLSIIKKIEDPRIVLIDQENKGLIETLNIRLKLCSGRYIARMDADDIAHPKRFELQLKAFKEDKALVLCSAGIIAFTDRGFLKKRYYPIYDEDIKSEFLFNSSIVHPLSMFDSDVINVNNIRFSKDYKYCEDYKFFYDISKLGRVKNISKFLLRYRIHDSSQTSIGARDSKDRFNKISLIHNQILKDYGVELTNKRAQLHYSLSLSSEIDKLTVNENLVDELFEYADYLICNLKFISKRHKASFKSNLGEKLIKVAMIHRKRNSLLNTARLLCHIYSLRALFSRIRRIIRYV